MVIKHYSKAYLKVVRLLVNGPHVLFAKYAFHGKHIIHEH